MYYQVIFKFALWALTLNVYAQPLAQSLSTFNNINSPPPMMCAQMSDEQLVAICVEESCGPPSTAPTILNSNTMGNYHSPATIKKIDQVAEVFAQRNQVLERYTQFVEEQQKAIKQINSPSQISDDEAEIILSEIITQIREKYPPQPPKDFGANPSFDDLVNYHMKLTVPDNSEYSPIFQEVIAAIDFNKNYDFAVVNGKKFMSKDELKNYLEKADFLQQEIKKRKLSSSFDFEQRKKILEKKGTTALAILYNELKQEAKKLGIPLEPAVCHHACKTSIINHIKREKLFIPQAIIAKLRQNFNYQDSIADCRSYLAISHIEALKSDEIRKEWPKLIARLKSNTSLGFSAGSKKQLLGKIQTSMEVQFNTSPLSFDKKDIAGIEELEETMKHSSLGKAFVWATSQTSFEKRLKVPRCHSAKTINILNDRVKENTENDTLKLIVSPFSCQHHAIGKEVMAHELAHAVSNFIAKKEGISNESREAFIKLRTCSGAEKATHKITTDYAKYPGDFITTEEDTADLFAHALSEDQHSFLGCALVMADGEKYLNIKLQTAPHEVHSSAVQRLMVELQYKNPAKISTACAEVIKRSKALIDRKCF